MELTLQSGQAYDHIRSGQMTPAMAAEYLRDGRVRVRNFGETLHRLYPGPDLQARLTAAFQGERDGLSAEPAGRRVRNRPNALKNIRQHREDVPRKLPLPLYVATENVIDGEYSGMDED